jgi:capsular exopolysaccharide family
MNLPKLKTEKDASVHPNNLLTLMDSYIGYDPAFFDQSHFRHILRVERMRTERSKKPFLLLLLDISRLIETTQDIKVVDKVKASLDSSLRVVDIRGWYHNNRTVGVLFTEIASIDEASIDDIIHKIYDRFFESMNPHWVEKIDISYFTPLSMATDQFKMLRDIIIKPGAGNTPKIIMVANLMSGEGKSLVAANLAGIIAAELHRYALLVDCDLRSPSLTRWFGLREQKGLSDYLTGEAEMQDLLIKTSIDKLSILSCGSIQDNPVELVSSNKMKTLVQDLKSRYEDRYIIIDSSPILATTEPGVLNEMVDGIILVIKSDDTPWETIQKALKLLNKDNILGVVSNNMQFKTKALFQR